MCSEKSLRSEEPVCGENALIPHLAGQPYLICLAFFRKAMHLPTLESFLPLPGSLPLAQRRDRLAAAREVRECHRVLEKVGLNVVSEVLRGQGDFIEMEHYPRNDVFDTETGSQYYYHAHRGSGIEHGHFHTFVRAGAMPDSIRRLDDPQAGEADSQRESAICHLVAISMDAWGYPQHLFTTNRWVTDETWYRAEDAITLLRRFEVDHAFPSWPVNRWITALLRLYRPLIEGMLFHRDAVVTAWRAAHPETDVFEDRRLDIIGILPVGSERNAI